MALVRPGPLVAAISGNVGAVNFAQTRYGHVLRKKLTRTRKLSERQLVQRSRFKIIQLAWIELTEDQRNAWRASAKLLRFTNRLGLSRHISGYQLYLKTSLPMSRYPLPTFTDPPLLRKMHAPYNVTWSITLPWNYLMDFEVFQVGLAEMEVFAARPMTSSPVTHFDHWRWIKGFNLTVPPMPPPINLFDEFIEAWGVPQAGEVTAIKLGSFSLYNLAGHFVQAQSVVV